MSHKKNSFNSLNHNHIHDKELTNPSCLSDHLCSLNVSDESKNGIDESSVCDDDEAVRSDDIRLRFSVSPSRRDSLFSLAVEHPLMAANVATSVCISPRVDSSSDEEDLKKPVRNNSKNNLYVSENGENCRPGLLKVNKSYLTSTPDRNTPPEFVDWNVSGVAKTEKPTTVPNARPNGDAALRSKITNKKSTSAGEIDARTPFEDSGGKSRSLGANLRTLTVTEAQNSDRFKTRDENGGVESKMASKLSDRLLSDALALDKHMEAMKSEAQRRRIEVPSGFLESSNETTNSEVSVQSLARIDLDNYVEGAWSRREVGPRFDIPMQLKATPAHTHTSPERSPLSSPSQEGSLRAVLDPYRGSVALRRPPRAARKKVILQISDDDTDCDDVDELDSFDRTSTNDQKSPSFNRKSPSFNGISPDCSQKSLNINQKTSSFNQESPSFNKKSPSSNHLSPASDQKSPSFNRESPSFDQKSPSFTHKSPSLEKSSEGFLSPRNHSHLLSPFKLPERWSPRQDIPRVPQGQILLRSPRSPRTHNAFRSPSSDRSPPEASVYEDAENYDESQLIPEYSLQQEREDLNSWLSVSLHDGAACTCDLRAVEPYKRVVTHGGYAPCGAAVILLSGCFFPPTSAPCYDHVMDNLFLYIIHTLQQLVTDEYVLVYLHAAADHSRLPRVRFMRNCYTMIDKRLRKNLKNLYIVHPTFYIKTVVWILKAVVSSKFMRKIVYAGSIDELSQHVVVEPACIADEVWQFERARQLDG